MPVRLQYLLQVVSEDRNHSSRVWLPGLIILVVLLVGGMFIVTRQRRGRRIVSPNSPAVEHPSSERILSERLAMGEIDNDEYVEKLALLREEDDRLI